MPHLAIRNVATYKGRSVATALAVALAAAFLAGTLVLTDTARAALDSTFARTYAHTDVYVRARSTLGSMGGDARPPIDAAVVREVAAVDGVAVAEARIEGYAQVFDRSGTAVGSPEDAVGSYWSELEGNPFRIVAGRPPQADHEVVIDRGTAETADVTVGDRVKVTTNAGPVSVTVAGISAFGSVDSPGGSPYVLFTHRTAQRLLTPPGRIDGVFLIADAGVVADALRDRIASVLGSDLEILTSAELASEHGSVTAEVTNAIRDLLLAFAAVALFVGGFIIHNTFSILVAQRTREIGVVRALGATRRQIVRSVLAEALAIGVLGAVPGALAGIGVAAGLRGLVTSFGFDIPSGALVIRPTSLVAPAVVATLLAVASAVPPARRAASVSPLAALRDAAVDGCSPSRGRLVAGAMLVAVGGALVVAPLLTERNEPTVLALGAAVTFLGLAALGPVLAPPVIRFLGIRVRTFGGMPAELARENAARNPRRTAGAAASLMIGIGLVTLISVFASSAKATISRPYGDAAGATPDFVIQPTSFDLSGFSPTLGRRIAQLPEIEEVAVARVAVAEVDGDPGMHLHAVEPRAWATMAGDTTVDGDSTELRDGEVSVLQSAAAARGWTIGSALTVSVAGQQQPLRVAATRSSGPPLLINLSTYESLVPEQLDVAVLANKRRSVSTDAAEDAVRTVLKDYPTASMLDAYGKSPRQVASIEQFANAVYVLLGLALVVALMGIGTTLALSVVERTREIGLLRAVGMTATQVTAMVRWESLLIVFFGSSVGISTGLLFGWAILQALPDHAAFRIPGGQLLAVTALAATAAIIAAAGPARRASRLRLLTAIAKP